MDYQVKLSRSAQSDIEDITRYMPEANDFNRLLIVIDTIDHSVRSNDDLANRLIFEFRYDTNPLRKSTQALGVFNQDRPKRSS